MKGVVCSWLFFRGTGSAGSKLRRQLAVRAVAKLLQDGGTHRLAEVTNAAVPKGELGSSRMHRGKAPDVQRAAHRRRRFSARLSLRSRVINSLDRGGRLIRFFVGFEAGNIQ